MSRRARPTETNDALSNSGAIIDQIILWLGQNWWWIVLALLVVFAITYGLRRLKQRHSEIQKLWIFTLFFLTKRQMLIPLVISLSRRDKILDKDTQKKLMAIRERCREVSFKKSPKARLELEKEVSTILFDYFSQIEKKHPVKPGTKFHKIIQDLEFIDAKLVQLQQVYNRESSKWNQQLSFPLAKNVLKPFGIKTFEVFS